MKYFKLFVGMHKSATTVEGKRLGRGRTKLMAELHATEYRTVEKNRGYLQNTLTTGLYGSIKVTNRLS